MADGGGACRGSRSRQRSLLARGMGTDVAHVARAPSGRKVAAEAKGATKVSAAAEPPRPRRHISLRGASRRGFHPVALAG